MNKGSRSITVIITTIQNRVHYIRKTIGRQDGRYMVELTTSSKEAQDFSLAKANEIVPKIFNPHDRVFTVEDTLIEA